MDKITKAAYEKLMKEDLDWLFNQPQTLERDHIESIIHNSIEYYYNETRIKQLEKLLRRTFECEDNRCDRCKEDIKKVLEDKDE